MGANPDLSSILSLLLYSPLFHRYIHISPLYSLIATVQTFPALSVVIVLFSISCNSHFRSTNVITELRRMSSTTKDNVTVTQSQTTQSAADSDARCVYLLQYFY